MNPRQNRQTGTRRLESAVMDRLDVVLKCTRCEEPRDFDRDGNVVRCDVCGKKHSVDSLHAV